MSLRHTVLAGWTRSLLDGVGRYGLSQERIASDAGLDPQLVHQGPDARVSGPADLAAWRLAERRVDDPGLGLHIAEAHISPASLGIVGYTAMTSATVGDALVCAASYSAIIKSHTAARFVPLAGGDAMIQVVEAAATPLPRAITDASIASYLVLARRWTGRAIRPRELWLRHGRPDSTAEYERLFDCPLAFARPVTALVFDREALATPLLTADPVLHGYLDPLARSGLAAVPVDDLDSELRAAITARLAEGDLRIERTARALGLSVRTLQRRLSERGVAYQDVVDRVRSDRARELLADGRTPIHEIGDRLAFSEPSAFRRAFKRWTGSSLAAYRRTQRGALTRRA